MPKSVSGFMRIVPEPVLLELGRVIAAWSHIEASFDMLYLGAVVMQEGSRGRMDDPRVQMMGAAFERRVRELRQHLATQPYGIVHADKWDRALSQLISLRHKRDFLAHGQIGEIFVDHGDGTGHIDQEACLIRFKSWRNSKPHEVARLTLTDLRRTFERMERLLWDLHDMKFVRP